MCGWVGGGGQQSVLKPKGGDTLAFHRQQTTSNSRYTVTDLASHILQVSQTPVLVSLRSCFCVLAAHAVYSSLTRLTPSSLTYPPTLAQPQVHGKIPKATPRVKEITISLCCQEEEE